MGKVKIPRDRQLLHKLYWGDELTLKQIGLRFGCTGHKIPDTVMKVFNKLGIPRRDGSQRQLGHLNHQWRGGRAEGKSGYILIKNYSHPRADKRGYVFEHILIWEKANGKPVPRGWQVHHKNGNKKDNRPENLEAMPARRHAIANLYNTIHTIEELEIEISRLKEENKKLREQSKCQNALVLDI